ncbi:DUF3265 domain-containing protein [Vibrio harveyi]|nr:DUF3265 domain-containing protein [Vibrio harveyi]WJT09109.1 DUF3265 domain-containing protein [Vibrio harveyi]
MLTSCLSVIRNAWHFVSKVVYGSFSIAPLKA